MAKISATLILIAGVVYVGYQIIGIVKDIKKRKAKKKMKVEEQDNDFENKNENA